MTTRSIAALVALLCLVPAAPRAAQETRPAPASRPSPESRPAPEPAAQLAIERALRARLAEPIAGPLDVDLLTLGEDFCGAVPANLRFSLDERFLVCDWKRWDEAERGTFVYDIEANELRRLDEGEEPPLGEGEVILSRDRRRALSSRHDRLVLVELASLRERVIMPLLGSVRAQAFADGGDRVVLREGDDLFAFGIEDGALRRLTRIEPDRKEPKRDERRRYLEEAERRLLRHLFEKDDARKKAEARREARETLAPFAPPRGFRVSRLEAADDLSRVLVTVTKNEGATATKMPRYLADDGYVTTFDARPKVGDDPSEARFALLDATTGAEVAVTLPAPLGEGPFAIRSQGFAPDSSRCVLLLRSRDNKRAALVEVARDGAARVLHEVTDEAWVRHVGDDAGFLADGRFWFTSEKTGFNHLYVEKTSGGEIEPLTRGDWLIAEVQHLPAADGAGERFLVSTSSEGPARRDLRLIPATGGEGATILADGWHRGLVSVRGGLIATTSSTPTSPPAVSLRRLGAGSETAAPIIGGTAAASPAFRSRGWIEPEFVAVPAGDGVMVPARLYRPRELKPGAPAVIFVHGAGYLQNVTRGWSSYYREYMFHDLLAARGYVVIDLDYRGSAGYGAKWRTAIYRHMGGRDLEDQVDAARWLVAEFGIDERRIGIYGGSYGGFITLMALFKHPGVFAAGAALRPVTDWAHYNHGYTANILNTPQEDPEAFERSSPIWFAEGLRDRLLVCHGLEDDNVQPQDSIRLAQRLIELRKTGWELALYPAEPHGFRDAASWADEYRRILRLFEETIGADR